MNTVKAMQLGEQAREHPSSGPLAHKPPRTRLSLTHTLAQWFIAPRAHPKIGWPEVLVFLVYCTVLLVAIPFHEPWSDEAQAWLLARDCSLHKLFFYQLHYEGTPGLWHLLLWAANRLHLPYVSMQYISAALAAGAVYVLMRFGPLPRAFCWLLPFTFWLQYQYAVVARNYAFFALSVFLLVWLYTKRKPQPILFAVVAGLTANESMHGALFATGIFAAYLLEQHHRKKQGARQAATGGRLLLATAILAACGAFAFWTAFPAPDNSNPLNSESVVSRPGVLWLRARITGIPIAPPSEPSAILAALDTGSKAPVPVGASRALRAKVQLADALLTYPISSSFVLAYLFVLSAAAFIVLYAGVRGLLPYLFLLPPMVFIHTADHHAGLLFLTLIGGLWMAWQAKLSAKKQFAWADASVATLLAIVLLLQIGWSWHAIHTDHLLPYDPGAETARFLKAHAAGKTVASLEFMTTSVQPYFADSPFANHPEAFWTWSTRQAAFESPEYLASLRPDMLVLPLTKPEAEFLGVGTLPGKRPFADSAFLLPKIEPWIQGHFRETHRFCGDEIGRGGLVAYRCNVIYEPK